MGNSLSRKQRNQHFFTQPLQISVKSGKVVGLLDIRVSDKFQIFNPSILFVTGIQTSQKKKSPFDAIKLANIVTNLTLNVLEHSL